MEKRICITCGDEKFLSDFRYRKDKNHLLKTCKECENKKSREYNHKNKEKIKTYQKQYDIDNRKKINETKTKYRLANKEKLNNCKNKLRKKRKLEDPKYKLSETVRRSIVGSIKRSGHYKNTKTIKVLGCTYSEFKIYIESKFETWMNWDNHGKYIPNGKKTWQLDHIIPISSAKTEDEIIKLNHYSNFQPLESLANIKKSNQF